MLRIGALTAAGFLVLAVILALGFNFFGNEEGQSAAVPEAVPSIEDIRTAVPGDNEIAVARSQSEHRPIIYILGGFLAVSLMGLVAVSGFAIRMATRRVWRIENAATVAPDEWLEHLDGLNGRFTSFEEFLGKVVQLVNDRTEGTTQNLDEMAAIFRQFHHKIDQQDKEITRLKGGYDTEILRRSLKPFMQLAQDLQTHQENLPPERVIDELYSAAEATGAEWVWPQVGQDFRNSEIPGLIADRPYVSEAESPSDNYKIHSVQRPALILRGGEWTKVVMPAVVTIYRSRGSA